LEEVQNQQKRKRQIFPEQMQARKEQHTALFGKYTPKIEYEISGFVALTTAPQRLWCGLRSAFTRQQILVAHTNASVSFP
jgi:hypothetical protein